MPHTLQDCLRQVTESIGERIAEHETDTSYIRVELGVEVFAGGTSAAEATSAIFLHLQQQNICTTLHRQEDTNNTPSIPDHVTATLTAACAVLIHPGVPYQLLCKHINGTVHDLLRGHLRGSLRLYSHIEAAKSGEGDGFITCQTIRYSP